MPPHQSAHVPILARGRYLCAPHAWIDHGRTLRGRRHGNHRNPIPLHVARVGIHVLGKWFCHLWRTAIQRFAHHPLRHLILGSGGSSHTTTSTSINLLCSHMHPVTSRHVAGGHDPTETHPLASPFARSLSRRRNTCTSMQIHYIANHRQLGEAGAISVFLSGIMTNSLVITAGDIRVPQSTGSSPRCRSSSQRLRVRPRRRPQD